MICITPHQRGAQYNGYSDVIDNLSDRSLEGDQSCISYVFSCPDNGRDEST